jgi:parallel beta-helix repeat protein
MPACRLRGDVAVDAGLFASPRTRPRRALAIAGSADRLHSCRRESLGMRWSEARASREPRTRRRRSMNRISLGIALVALVLIGPAAGVVHAATIVVDDDGGQCTAAFTTIQAAVNSAVPGDTIRVCPGEYFEEVTIDDTKTNLRLVGGGLTELKAPLLGISPVGFLVEADGVVIENFRISGYNQCGILVNGDRATIQGNEVHHNEFNICLQFSDESRVRSNLVHAATVNGISISDGSGNEVSGNRVTGGDVGIFAGGDSDSVVHHNSVFGAFFAIEVSFSSGTVVRNNTVQLALLGIVGFTNGGLQLVSNSVRDTIFGLGVDDCTGCTVSRNSVNFNNPGELPDSGGILLANLEGSTVSQNAASRNGVVDCSWDGLGANVFERNACGVEVPAGAWD